MPVQIGPLKQASVAEPFALLRDCHRRVELFLGVLVRLAEPNSPRPLSKDEAEALEKSLKYFRDAAPLHTADEEDSVFPRLRACGDPEAQQILEMAEALERDHRSAKADHNTVERLGQVWLSAGLLSQPDYVEFRSAVRALADMYGQHIAIEDNTVFPAAEKLLKDNEKQEITQEMASRRGFKAQQ